MRKLIGSGLAIAALVGFQSVVLESAIASTTGHASGLCSFRHAKDSSKNIVQQPCTAAFGSVMTFDDDVPGRVLSTKGFLQLTWQDGVTTKIETVSYPNSGKTVTTIDGEISDYQSDCDGTRNWIVNGNHISFQGKLLPYEKSFSCD